MQGAAQFRAGRVRPLFFHILIEIDLFLNGGAGGCSGWLQDGQLQPQARPARAEAHS